jgi:alpha-tubulin suppressor-like RCC1 family protein
MQNGSAMRALNCFARWPEQFVLSSRPGGSPEDSPVLVRGLEHITAVAAGLFHSIALGADGRVWSWGRNLFGALATGSRRDSRVPVPVASLGKAVSICAGADHSIAVCGDGSVWAWGAHRLPGADPLSLTPDRVVHIHGAMAAAAGSAHSLVLGADGTVWGWGENTLGQIGDGGEKTESPRRIRVGGVLIDDVIAIAADDDRSFALRADGKVISWGVQLSEPSAASPTAMPNRLKEESDHIVAVEKGFRHSIALTAEGLVWAWGDNSFGQLGNPVRLFGR